MENNLKLKAPVDKIQVIRQSLPRGIQKEIARKVGLSAPFVSQVLCGLKYNYEIVEEALKIYEAEKKRIDEQIEKLNKIVK
jgi:hypothetical protein